MKKKKNTHNDIAMAYRIESLRRRKRISKIQFLRILLAWLRGELAELPRGWEITWIWRNSAKSELKKDTIQNTVAESRESFVTLMERRIERDLNSLGFTANKRATKKRQRKAKAFKKRHAKSSDKKRMSRLRQKKSKRAHRRRRRKAS